MSTNNDDHAAWSVLLELGLTLYFFSFCSTSHSSFYFLDSFLLLLLLCCLFSTPIFSPQALRLALLRSRRTFMNTTFTSCCIFCLLLLFFLLFPVFCLLRQKPFISNTLIAWGATILPLIFAPTTSYSHLLYPPPEFALIPHTFLFLLDFNGNRLSTFQHSVSSTLCSFSFFSDHSTFTIHIDQRIYRP